VFTKAQLAEILAVDGRTIDRYLKSHGDELKANGYQILKGKSLKDIKLADVDDIHVVDIIDPKAPSLGVFTFRAILNIAMLVTESERAKAIRSRMLDIVLDVVAQKTGGHTKYINQRDDDYLPSAYQEYSYRKIFTSALSQYLNMGGYKYGVYTNKIYQLIFKENAKEYKRILSLSEKDKVRDTFYAEVLKAIASVENGLAEEMKQRFEALGRQLTPPELDMMIQSLENNPYLRPVIEDARTKMASRDLSFRDALHIKLEAYLQSVPESDFDRFLGETSRSLEEQLSDSETLEVLKRLKDR
ncbi:MAG: DNA-binding protein, partial [Mariprofundaceae bacterium]|nr:DNA-binding protein [Mariprofundaceae bacterium]